MNRDLIVAWAAGIVEGEGYIGVTGNKVVVAVEMTDLDVLEKLHDNFGGSLLIQKLRNERWKQSWRWQLTGTLQAKAFLKLIYPFLGSRRQARADEAFAIVTKEQRKEELVAKVYELRNQGLTHKAISDIIGCDRSYISHILRKRNC